MNAKMPRVSHEVPLRVQVGGESQRLVERSRTSKVMKSRKEVGVRVDMSDLVGVGCDLIEIVT